VRSLRRISTRERGMFFAVSGSGEIRYKGKSVANTSPMPKSVLRHPAGLRARSLSFECNGAVQFLADPRPLLAGLRPRSDASAAQVIERGQRLPNLAPLRHADCIE